MSDRERLAADLRKTHDDYWDDPHLPSWSEFYADRLIALGWRKVECWCPVESPEQPGGGVNPHCPQHGTTLDEERLARALRVHYDATPEDDAWHCLYEKCAAAIAKAYREDSE